MAAGLATAAYEIYASISGISGYWEKVTGATRSRSGSDVYDGGDPKAGWLPGRATYDVLTLSRPFEFPRDFNAMETLQDDLDRRIQRTVVVYYQQDDGIVANEAYIGFTMSVTRPDGDASSSSPTALQVQIKVTDKA